MKKLQQNFTTTEQSKRLLELGVPEDSADLVIESGCDVRKTIPSWTVFTKWCQNRRDYSVDYEKFMPCWSVGRLIEIYLICNEVIDNVTELHHSAIKIDVREFNIVEYIIKKLTTKVKKNKGFFSKLEE
jgi:hypothetical protein